MEGLKAALTNLTPSLAREVTTLLAKLLMLSEGSSQSFNSSGAKRGKVEGSIPKGARFDRKPDQPPSADVSLWEHYSFRFGKAAMVGNEIEIRRLLILAQRDYDDVVKRPDHNRIQLQVERDEQADIRLLLEHGQGIAAVVIAVENRWPVSWVRLQRERGGQEPETGTVREPFRELAEEDRHKLIDRLRRDGNSQREVAMRLGVSNGTVARYWPRQRTRAA